MHLEIRQAHVTDRHLLRKIAIKSYYDTFAVSNTKEDMDMYLKEAFSEKVILEELQDTKAVCWLALVDGGPAGYARMRVNTEVEDELGKSAIEIHRMYALADFIGKGVGSGLMKRCLDYARSANFQWVWLGVWEKNGRAQEFYKRWGFEKFSEHPFMMGRDPQIDWLLKKRINFSGEEQTR